MSWVLALLPIRLAAPIEAPRIVTGGKVRAAAARPENFHTCSMGLRSGKRAQSIRSISSLSKSCSAATVR
ncbi:hypothetical protein TNCV_4962651 [Trichonephila clavipes]|nr:hypothetical protein TNCV_4962651 [Trichonephila clavipes]